MSNKSKIRSLEKNDKFNVGWDSVLLLINKSVSSHEYHFYLYLLILQSEGVLNDLIIVDSINPSKKIKESIFKFKGESADTLQGLFEFVEHIINRVDTNVLNEILIYNRFLCTEFFTENGFLDNFFDITLDIFNKWQDRNEAEKFIPEEVVQFVYDLAKLPKNATVYNPFAGFASFGLPLKNDSSYFGQESHQFTAIEGALRLIAYQKRSQSVLKISDSVQNWNPNNIKFDLIVSFPPIGVSFSSDIFGKFGAINSYEEFLLEQGIQDLKKQGKLIAIIYKSFLFGSNSKPKITKYLIDNDLIETIISTPDGYLFNNLPLAIIVINKNKIDSGYVKFIDCSDAITEISKKERNFDRKIINKIIKEGFKSKKVRRISNEKISKFDYSLIAPFYFELENYGVELGEILIPINGQKGVEGSLGKVVRIKDLKSSNMDFKLNIESLKELPLSTNFKKIEESCLLVARRWNTLKSTIYDYTGTPIYITNDIAAFKIDETKVNIGYLLNEFYSDRFLKLFNIIRTGITVPSLSIRDFLKLQMELPSINIQEEIVNRNKELFIEEKLNEVEHLKQLIGLKSEVQNQNNFLRHSIAGNMANLRGAFKRIKSILDNQTRSLIPDIMTLKDDPKSNLTVNHLMQMMERDIEKITADTQRNSKEEENLIGNLVPLEVWPFLEEYINELNVRSNPIYRLEFNETGSDLIYESGSDVGVSINGDKNHLKAMLNNIISNAEIHAFESKYKRTNVISISAWVESAYREIPVICISISNTGKKLPENFNSVMFATKGGRAGENSGDGIGGWYISKVIEMHEGNLEIDDEQGFEGIRGIWSTSFQIELPILNFGNNESI